MGLQRSENVVSKVELASRVDKILNPQKNINPTPDT